MDRRSWQRLVDRFESSDVTQREFADSSGVSVGTFRYWLYRLRRERMSSSQVEFVEVEARSVVRECGPAAACRIVTEGAEILLAELPPADWIAEVVGELGATSC